MPRPTKRLRIRPHAPVHDSQYRRADVGIGPYRVHTVLQTGNRGLGALNGPPHPAYGGSGGLWAAFFVCLPYSRKKNPQENFLRISVSKD